jgi:photosystem II stability/assembly factor-like uncharacterized protein
MIRVSLSLSAIVLFAMASFAQWSPQVSQTAARLRGVSAVSDSVAWASGENGACLRTTDGGKSWKILKVPGAESLDFRDVDAFDANSAYLLSIGEGERSRIYKTIDGGAQWTLQFTNRNPKAFFDAMAFWDARTGIAVSDPVDGSFVIVKTTDAGATWQQIPSERIPRAIEGEAAFAASGTCVTVQGRDLAWFATGGGAARVFRSTDRGNTWAVSTTPIKAGSPSTGLFSIAFADARNGIVVGGDYRKEQEASDNAAVTIDGGKTWKLSGSLGGFRSGVRFVPGSSSRAAIAVGPSGSDYSDDGGITWRSLGPGGYHALSFGNSAQAGWAVGETGRIGKYSVKTR